MYSALCSADVMQFMGDYMCKGRTEEGMVVFLLKVRCSVCGL